MYSLESQKVILMSIHNKHFHDKTRKFSNITINICLLELSEELEKIALEYSTNKGTF